MSNEVKEQLNLSMPSALENIVVALISMTDTYFVSKLGSEAIAAVGAMISILFFLNLGMKSIQIANNVTVANGIGANEKEKIKIITGNSVLLVSVIQILLSIITLIISPIIPFVFKVSDICLIYLSIRLIGIIPQGIGYIIAGYERTLGKTKFVMYIRIISLILNGILDYLAIKLNYGVAGVAIATVITEFINTFILLIYAKKGIIYKFNKQYMVDIVKLAKFEMISRMFYRGTKLVLNIILSRIGMYEYVAHIIVNRIEDFIDDFIYGFGSGITTKIGIVKGKNNIEDYKKIREAIDKIIRAFSIILPILTLILLLILLPNMLIETEALKIGYKLIPFIVVYSFLLPYNYEYSSIIAGLKELKYKSKLSTITNTIKLILSYILCAFLGVIGYWLTFIIVAVILIIAYKNKEKKIISLMSKE